MVPEILLQTVEDLPRSGNDVAALPAGELDLESNELPSRAWGAEIAASARVRMAITEAEDFDRKPSTMAMHPKKKMDLPTTGSV
eukprot:CAMPEP_0204367988 /NCGR_PEP_ID=MMETSP0469-20131031/43855_1 /ASSEMBLY_ACC=CAM_ASM_000384 /TAXON_ID=2969 /ORGANISM="Oxyrrhis marina" /LENGTH=83 /DNA_ID=CAMNT_0051357477 /DNA_START=111 /DNA_END=362 /DNA_ORIENTATION=-